MPFYTVGGSALAENTVTGNTAPVNMPPTTISGRLIARPKLCMTERTDRTCTMDVELVWETNWVSDFCIYSSVDEAIIGCWQAMKQGEKTIAVLSTEDIKYRLVANNSRQTIAATTVSILSVSHKPSQTRRRRHAWSLF